MNAVDTAREAVLAQLEPIELEEAQVKERLSQLAQTKAPLIAALKALTTGTKGRAKAARKDSKPHARKPDIRAVCLALVEDNPAITKEELTDLAEHKLIEDLGFSPSGVALQLGKCMSSAMFAIGPDGSVTIASKSVDSKPTSEIEMPKLSVESSSKREKVD